MDADAPGFNMTLPTHPAAKKVLVDKYAEIALFDAEQNQKEILRVGALEQQKKVALKKELDEQIRVKQAAMLKERAQEREWVEKEQMDFTNVKKVEEQKEKKKDSHGKKRKKKKKKNDDEDDGECNKLT